MNTPKKFRVWDKAKNKFINPFKFEWDDYYKTTGMVLLDLNGKIRIADYSSGNGDNSASSVYSEVDNPDNYIVQEYTGLTDKNGNPICEDDIVKWGDLNYLVEWNDIAYKWQGRCPYYHSYHHPTTENFRDLMNGIIISNIFEHKHLLEK